MADLSASDDPSSLTNAELVRRCHIEQQRYRQGLPSDDRYCLELYRRAIIKGDQEAWRLFQDHVARLPVENWLRQHPHYQRALKHAETHDNLIHLTFARFWKAVGPSQKTFPAQAELMYYLKICVNSVIIDELRSAFTTPEPIPPDTPAPEPDPLRHVSQQELWACITHTITDQRELLLCHLILNERYRPREIVPKFPQYFATTHEIHRLWRNIIDRLRRAPCIRRWFERNP
jgi:DNA-directed RNA polymerase specialized sigma24 family protein